MVPTPEIELQDLKFRGTKNYVSRSVSSSVSNSRSNSGRGTIKSDEVSSHNRDKGNHGLRQFLSKCGCVLN